MGVSSWLTMASERRSYRSAEAAARSGGATAAARSLSACARRGRRNSLCHRIIEAAKTQRRNTTAEGMNSP